MQSCHEFKRFSIIPFTCRDFLKPLTDSLGIRIRLKKNLPAITDIKMAMGRGFGKGKI